VPIAAASKVSIVFAILRFSFDSLSYGYRLQKMDTDKKTEN